VAAEPFPNREAIARSQLEQLRVLLRSILPANRFYAAKFAAAGFSGNITTLPDFSAHAPFTTKQELAADQQAHPPYGTDLTFPLQRYTRYHQTSGTGGAPLRWLDTPESWDWMVRNWESVYRAAGVAARDRVFFAFSFGPFLGFWLAFEAAARLGCLCLPGGGLSSSARLRAILEHSITVLCCTPTYALRVAEVADEEGIDLARSRVKVMIVAGEPGGSIPATRAQLERRWPGARLFDHHGMTEIGPVTFQCPARPGVLHVMEHAYFAEVIDPESGHALPADQTGELVLTNLARTGSPLLRYRTGDLVKVARDEVCACGRSDLALEGGILGRADDMIVVRGVNIYPSAVEAIIRGCGGIAEYQVRVRATGTLPELSLRIEPAPDRGDPAALARGLEKAFEETFVLRVPVTTVPPGSLPRFEMKARRWVRE
jgi:phenylacetate-CoA ligase